MISLSLLTNLLVCIFCLLQGVYLNGPNIQHLQKIYEMSSPGEMPCYYDGSLCKRDAEYCSIRSKTCEPVFPTGSTEISKLAICKNILSKNDSEHGQKDTCIYFLGVLESRKDDYVKHQDEKNIQGSHPLQGIGKEFCPFAGKDCQLGIEICNSSSKQCEPLFPPGATDEEKRHKCHEVFMKNITLLWDGCIYALGLLEYSKNQTDAVDSKKSSNVWGISVTVILAVAAIVISVLVCKLKKMFCFKNIPARKPAKQNTHNGAIESIGASQSLLPGNVNKENEQNTNNGAIETQGASQSLLPGNGNNENEHNTKNGVLERKKATQNLPPGNGDNEDGRLIDKDIDRRTATAQNVVRDNDDNGNDNQRTAVAQNVVHDNGDNGNGNQRTAAAQNVVHDNGDNGNGNQRTAAAQNVVDDNGNNENGNQRTAAAQNVVHDNGDNGNGNQRTAAAQNVVHDNGDNGNGNQRTAAVQNVIYNYGENGKLE